MKDRDIDNGYYELIEFLQKEFPWLEKEKISLKTNIVEELKLWGDDCLEFLEKFCEYFNVNCSNLEAKKCGEEGFNPFEIIIFVFNLIRGKKSSKQYGYTIEELLELKNCGDFIRHLK
jgi:hypothetical protein